MRAFADEVYGIPNQNVIGSSLINRYDDSTRTVQRSSKNDLGILDSFIALLKYDKDSLYPDGYPTTPSARQPVIVNPFNDYEGKAVGAERYLGKKPIMTVGNSSTCLIIQIAMRNTARKLYSSTMIRGVRTKMAEFLERLVSIHTIMTAP